MSEEAILGLVLLIIVGGIALVYVFFGNPLCVLTGGHKPKKQTEFPFETVCEKCGDLLP